MSMVELTIDEDESIFRLQNSSSAIGGNRRAKSYFEDVLNGRFTDEGALIIPYEGDERDIILTKIHDALKKYGIAKEDSEGIKQALSRYYADAEDFRVFSEKAREIWSNRVVPQDLEDFMKVVGTRVWKRTMYPRQILAAFHLAFSQNACNFSVPGAGKTSMVYGAYAYLNNLPANVQEIQFKIVNAFWFRSAFMVGSFVCVLLAVFLYRR